MSSRRLQDALEDKKMLHWRGHEDVLKTYLRYDILGNKKLDVKKFIPKISEEFTIGINLTSSNA